MTKERILKMFMEQPLDVIAERIALVAPYYDFSSPIAKDCKITDKAAIIEDIKKSWPGLTPYDVHVDNNKRNISFKLRGTVWVPKRYAGCILFRGNYALSAGDTYDKYGQLEECDHEYTLSEECPDTYTMQYNEFPTGLKIEWV